MNYRHVYHAGNFADVHKHVALTALLSCLKKKETPFGVIDTHAGGGLYLLSGEEAVRSGEAGEGIAKLAGYPAQSPALAAYLELAAGYAPEHYPGSPLIAAGLLRPQDRLIAIEKQDEEFRSLGQSLAQFGNARALPADGYVQLAKLVPPPERRGLVLLDPPYEQTDEWRQLARSFAQAYRRFANGIYAIWYPLKSAVPAAGLAGELKNAGAGKLLSLVFDVGRRPDDPSGRLSASGLLVVSPPFGFAEEMEAAQNELLPLMRRGPDANTKVRWLAGAP